MHAGMMIAGIAALTALHDGSSMPVFEEEHQSVGGGRVFGGDNGKEKSRAVMPFRDRNAVCECGSGKKRKKCCKGKS